MNVQGLCTFGAADEAKVRRLIKIAEREKVMIVGVQEIWFKKKRHLEEMIRATQGTEWMWYGKTRGRQSSRARKGSGGVGFLVHSNAGDVRVREGKVDGDMWMELTREGEVTHVVNMYLVPANSTRARHNECAMAELERVLAEMPDERRIVLGDWNRRVGETPSFVFTGSEEAGGEACVLE